MMDPAGFMKKFLLLLLLILGPSMGFSADIALPPASMQTCVACHGQTGVSTNPAWPNLAGQHEAYLVKQLTDLKEGKMRKAPVMAAMVASLSPTDIQALAAFLCEPSGQRRQDAQTLS